MGFFLDIVEAYGLMGLFISIFFSYSIFPSLTIAPVLVSVQLYNPWLVFLVSMAAATLGSIVNYYIGLKGIRRFLPKGKILKNAEKRINKYGPFAIIFLTWLPFVGDPIIIAAGVLRMNFWKFLIYSTLSKVWYLALIIFFGIIIV